MDMAERLQDLRKKANYSQEQVSDMLGISRQAISKCDIVNISLHFFLKDV